MKFGLNLFFIIVAAYGLLALLSPRTAMKLRSNPSDDAWMTGGALYKTPARTRLTGAGLVAMALLVFIAQIFDRGA